MTTCQICRFDAEVDDVVLRRGEGGCICVACYYRETDNTLRMSKALRRELNAEISIIEDGGRVVTDPKYGKGNHPG